MFKINNYLLSAERFAIEWVTVYGEWAIPKSISIVDLPGFTFSDDPQVISSYRFIYNDFVLTVY